MRHLLPLCVLLLSWACGPARAADWQGYDTVGGSTYELDADSVRSAQGQVFFRYRQRWAPETRIRTIELAGVVDCSARRRSDVAANGLYALREVYRGTGQEKQLELACRIAAGDRPVAVIPNSVIRLVDPQPRIRVPPLAPTEPLRVAFVYVGSVGDSGWTYAHDQGRRALEAQLAGPRVQVTWVERVPEGPAAVPVLRKLAEAGNQLIFTTSFGYEPAVRELAPAYPRVKFEVAGGLQSAGNVRTYDARGDEGAYLAGLLAGGMTRTGTIGFVGPVPIPDVVRNIDAFALGARQARPDARVRVAWVGSWLDPAKEAEAARQLVAAGADVLLPNTDSPAVLATAQRLGARAIGWQSDMRAFAPRAHLGSVVMDWGRYYAKSVRAALDGSWYGGRSRWGVSHGAVGLESMASDVPEPVRARIAQAVAGLKEASFSVWHGPIRNQDGRLMVGADSAIDSAHLDTLYFYVEGVDGQLPARPQPAE